MTQVIENLPAIERLASIGTAVLCTLVLLGLFIYGIRKLVPLLNTMNSLIANNTEVTKASCQSSAATVKSINAQTSLLQDMKTGLALHDQRSQQLQNEVSGIGQKVDRLEQTVSQINTRVDTVANSVSVIQGRVSA